ncbi:hypothetical protein ACFQU2_12915 [Siccirubricoccus deserti]
MRSLIEGELAPFLAPDVRAGSPEPRATLDGPPIILPPAAAQPCRWRCMSWQRIP